MELKKEKSKNAKSFTLDKVEFFESRMTKVEDALIVEQANRCMERCKQPVDVLKRVMSSNLKEVTQNIQGCTQSAQKIDEQTNQVSIDFDRAALCLEKNIEIMQLLNQKLTFGMGKFREEFM